MLHTLCSIAANILKFFIRSLPLNFLHLPKTYFWGIKHKSIIYHIMINITWIETSLESSILDL